MKEKLLLLMLLLCSVCLGTKAVTVNGGTFYFDNSVTNWTNQYKYLVVGKDDGNNTYSNVYSLNSIANTKLYYYDMSAWNGATYVGFIGNDSEWGSGSWGSSNLSNAVNHVGPYTGDFTFGINSLYMFNESGNPTYISAYTNLNNTQTFGSMVSTDGTTYAEATTQCADMTIDGYAFTSYNTCGAISQVSASNGTATANTGYTSDVTLTVSNVQDGYRFMGFYDASGNCLQAATTDATQTYTYNQKAATTVKAYFAKTYSISYSINNSSITDLTPKTAIAGETVSFKLTPAEGLTIISLNAYKGTDATGEEFEVTDNGNDNYSFTMPASNVFITATAEEDSKHEVVYSASPQVAGILYLGTLSSGTVVESGTTINVGLSKVTISAAAKTGYRFTGWEKTGDVTIAGGSQTDTNATATITATGSGTVNAKFAKDGYTVNVKVEGEGTVDKTELYFPSGAISSYTVTATPNPGYKLEEWQVDNEGITISPNATSNTIEVQAEANGTLTAYFMTDNTVSVLTYDANYPSTSSTSGTVPAEPTAYTNNTVVTVAGNTGKLACSGYVFTGWNTAADGTGTSYKAGDTFTITTATTLYATWTEYVAEDIYLVSPELTGGQCLPYFKLTETRNFINAQNEPGGLNNTYLNLSIKDDDMVDYTTKQKIANGTTIHYWYQNESGTLFYSPTDNTDHEFTSAMAKVFENTEEQTYRGEITPLVGTTKPTHYYYFSKGISTDHPAKSYVFCLDTEVATDNHYVKLYYTTNITEQENGFKVIGNFTNSSSYGDAMSPTNTDNQRSMTKYYYFGGAAYTTLPSGSTEAQADSVVYRAHIEKPSAGWGNLCMVVASTDRINNYSDATKTAFWRYAIRPLVQLGYQVDGRAVHGSLIAYTEGYNQSLNPRIQDLAAAYGMDYDDVQSVEFSMNITTSTYRFSVEKQVELTLYDFKDVHYNDIAYYPTDYINEKREIVGRGTKYRYFTSWSDDVAYVKPDYIDVFVVSAVTKGTDGLPKVTFNKLNISYIPANVGVVLAAKDATDFTGQYEGYDTYQEFYVGKGYYKARPTGDDKYLTYVNTLVIPTTVYTGETTTVTSLLVPQFESTMIPKTWYKSDGTAGGNNYLFGYYRAIDVVEGYTSSTQTSNTMTYGNTTEVTRDFLFGYWISAGTNPCNKNTSYLHLTTDQCDLNSIGTKYDYANWDTYASGAKTLPAALIDFSAFDDESVDGISAISNNVPTGDNDAYYTLDGVKIAQPTSKGIYIHNGKKFIVK